MEVACATIRVDHASQVHEARRAGAKLAAALHFDATTAGQLAIVITETGTNLVKHGGGGQILMRPTGPSEAPSVEILALDRGRGMVDVLRSLADGHSTTGTAGTGLGAIRRLSLAFDVYSKDGHGTAVMARVGARHAPLPHDHDRLQVEGLSVPKPGEDVCGDAWAIERRLGGRMLLVVDGLGHGIGAAEAASAALRVFNGARSPSPAERIQALTAGLRPTRGAALAVADVDGDRRVVRFAGIGNIGAVIIGESGVRHLVSHNGTAGHIVPHIREYTYPWPACGTLVMYSDGLATVRDLDAYPGLLQHHPSVVAGVLFRDLCRGRDDVTVVVAKEAA